MVYLDGWRPVATIRGGTIYRIHTDHLGTPRDIFDPTDTVVWSWDIKEPFGDQAPVSPVGFVFDHRFAGQWADAETGLYHNGFRDYHPGVGRYVRPDPTVWLQEGIR